MLLMMETAGRQGNVTPNVSQPENIQVCVCVMEGLVELVVDHSRLKDDRPPDCATDMPAWACHMY